MSRDEKSKPATLVVIDDEPGICQVLEAILSRDAHEVRTFTNPRAGLQAIRELRPDIVIHDLRMPEMSGIELIQQIKEISEEIVCIVITAFDTWDNAVEAMRLGAYSYVKKPFDNEDIRSMVDRAIEQIRLARDGATDTRKLATIVGNNPAMRGIESLVRRVARTDSTILITGENGTGKERLALAVHHLSLRKHGPFVPLNCGGLTESLLESELFGHAKGSFTGAVTDRRGYFETADGGTLFMDEVGEMSLATQVKVLRVLEDRIIVPVGASEGRRVDVRIIAATNRDLEQEVAAGRFRTDLYYRFNVIPVKLPPLRERKDDIPALAGSFLAAFAQRFGKEVRGFDRDAVEALLAHDWPGNIRELQNTIERAVTLAEGTSVTVDDLRGKFSAHSAPQAHALLGEIPPDGLDLDAELARVEMQYMTMALSRCKWNQTQAAGLLGMSFRSFRYKMKKYALPTSPAEAANPK